MEKAREREADLTEELILALHRGRSGEEIAKINEKLQKYNDNAVNNLMTVVLREAIILDLGGSVDNFTNFWFMRTVQSTTKKFESYGCTWALVAGCVTAVLGFAEVASVIPKNIGSYISAMVVAGLIDRAAKDEAMYEKILDNLVGMGLHEMEAQRIL